jgi:cysteine-rich repeat protein
VQPELWKYLAAGAHCEDGDSCCPQGCNGGNDSDCTIECGNSIPEPGEECDDGNSTAGDGCDHCVRETPERACTMLTAEVGSVATACLECMCDKCADEMVDCFATGSADDRQTCSDLAICRLRTWCMGLDCYNGPCMAEVVACGMSTSVVTLISRASDPQHRFGRATDVENCSQARCTDACGR